MRERDAPHPGDIYARENQNRAELAARYPDQFSGPNIGLSWPDGWHALVVGVCAFAAEQQILVRWRQIKEKLAELRMYARGGSMPADITVSGGTVGIRQGPRETASLRAKIKEAEEASRRTCCLCGTSDAAADVKRRVFDGWWLTACDACTPKIRAYHAWAAGQS